jgi:hypothetical protein
MFMIDYCCSFQPHIKKEKEKEKENNLNNPTLWSK